MIQKKQARRESSNLKDVKKVFNDGICYVYRTQERQLTEMVGRFNFSTETVGITQFWEAKVNNIGIDCSIGIPYVETVNNQCIVRIGNQFYKIVKMTYKDDLKPNWWKLALERSVFSYVNGTE